MGQSHLILGGEKVIDLKNRVPHPVWDSETIRSAEWHSGTSLGPLTSLVETKRAPGRSEQQKSVRNRDKLERNIERGSG